MRIFGVDFEKAQRGWKCTVYFRVTTMNQFTDECHLAKEGHKWWPLAFWRAWRAAKRLHQQLAAKPGERAKIGW